MYMRKCLKMEPAKDRETQPETEDLRVYNRMLLFLSILSSIICRIHYSLLLAFLRFGIGSLVHRLNVVLDVIAHYCTNLFWPNSLNGRQ